MKLPELKIGDKIAKMPIIQGGMAIRLSTAKLAAAVANSGGIGLIAASGMSLNELRNEIRLAKSLSKGVIGINASPLVADEYKLSIKNVAARTYHFMFKANIIHDKELCDLLIEPVDMGNYDTFEVEKGREIFELGYQSSKIILQSQSNK